ncbi:Cortactin-binding protein-2 [Mactra antiquata]
MMADFSPKNNEDFSGVDDCLKVENLSSLFSFGSSFKCCPWAQFSRPNPMKLGKWKLVDEVNTSLPGDEELNKVLPVREVDWEKIRDYNEDGLQITWIGHASMLVQFEGLTILTDPVLQTYCGPDGIPSFLKYKRYREAALQVEELVKQCKTRDSKGKSFNLDAVVISHNHYDHLESDAVRELSEHLKEMKWYVASGMTGWMEKHGVQKKNIVELEWWHFDESLEINGKPFKFICTPTQHWCQRSPIDFNKALWCGWVVKGPTKSFYFAGDTGYNSKLFTTIGEKYGPFDLAAIPIGAYEPRYITEFQHVDPKEAVNIHCDIRSKLSIGMHWGTFELTNEFFAEPPQKVKEEMLNKELDPSKFFCIYHGETWRTGEQHIEREFMTYPNPKIKNTTDEVEEEVCEY